MKTAKPTTATTNPRFTLRIRHGVKDILFFCPDCKLRLLWLDFHKVGDQIVAKHCGKQEWFRIPKEWKEAVNGSVATLGVHKVLRFLR